MVAMTPTLGNVEAKTGYCWERQSRYLLRFQQYIMLGKMAMANSLLLHFGILK